MGFSVGQFFSILTAVAPVVLLAVPGGAVIAPLVPLILKGIADAQAKPGATGPQKKAYVMALVSDAVKATSLVRPGILDQVLAIEAAGHGIDAVISSINAVQVAHAALPGLPVIVVPPVPRKDA